MARWQKAGRRLTRHSPPNPRRARRTPCRRGPIRPMSEPNPAAQGAAAYRRRLTPKQMEAEVFTRATRAIRAVGDGAGMDRVRATADNRRLWSAVYGAVTDPTNALPREMRAQIASIALAVIRECDAESPDLGFVAEMNEHFAAGLWH
jgi:flagellar biosynthesis regulator FlaF